MADIDPIVKKNLKLMYLFEEGGMLDNLSNESMGGNGGSYKYEGKHYPCSGANFFYDLNTGEIIYFGNVQEVPNKIRYNPHYKGGTFRIALIFDLKKRIGFHKIVNVYLSSESSAYANQMIALSVRFYNQIEEKKYNSLSSKSVSKAEQTAIIKRPKPSLSEDEKKDRLNKLLQKDIIKKNGEQTMIITREMREKLKQQLAEKKKAELEAELKAREDEERQVRSQAEEQAKQQAKKKKSWWNIFS